MEKNTIISGNSFGLSLYRLHILFTVNNNFKVNGSLSHEGIKSGSPAEKCVHTVSHLRKLRSPKTPHKQ